MDIQPASTLPPHLTADPSAPAPEDPLAAENAPTPGDDVAPAETTGFTAYGANARPVTARAPASGTISLLA